MGKHLSKHLSKQQIAEIKHRYEKGGEHQKDLAKEFGVSRRTISYHCTDRRRPALTLEQKLECQRRYRDGERQLDLAKEFGVAPGTMSAACRSPNSPEEARELIKAYANGENRDPCKMKHILKKLPIKISANLKQQHSKAKENNHGG